MLNDYKNSYREVAETKFDLNKIDKNELCYMFIASSDADKEVILAAIIYKFWYIIGFLYKLQQKKIATELDCYDIFIDTINYILEKHVWTNEDHSLYNDPKAPEKAIVVKARSLLGNFFVAQTRQKRNLNSDALPYEDYFESEDNQPEIIDDSIDATLLSKKLFNDYFNKKMYFEAFTLDGIINGNFFELNQYDELVFDFNKLKCFLKKLSPDYLKIIAEIYDIDYNKLEVSSKYVTDLPVTKIETKISDLFNIWGHDKEFLNLLKGAYSAK